jgi:predicted transcriptional regulator of viral defense system
LQLNNQEIPGYHTMKHKNISFQSYGLLQSLIIAERSCFDINDAQKILPDISRSALRELLRDMTRRGLLMRVKKGLYYAIPFEQSPETFMPEWHLLAECMVKGNGHYLAYYSALQIHNLTTQPALNELIVTDHQIKPSVTKIKEVSFQFIYHNKKHFFGAKKIWIDSYHKVLCSDLEKTFVDCLFNPRYAGGIVETGKALYKARQSINYEILLGYCIQFGSQAVIKRLGFLLELLKIENPIIDELQKMRTNTYIQLDSEMPKEGRMFSRWGIQQNIDTETIQSAINT